MSEHQTTTLSREEAAKTLRAGSPAHYSAYVGPPALYDFMGATQFRLLTTLGLRDTHNLLDFGCGSLRAGRLLIPYLLPGRYFGVEPNAWLVEEAIINQSISKFRFIFKRHIARTAFGRRHKSSAGSFAGCAWRRPQIGRAHV